MILEIDNRQDKIEVTKELESLLEQCITAVLHNEGINWPVEVSLVLADNKVIQKINKEYREVDNPTDVLSFPMLEFDKDINDLTEDDLKGDMDPDKDAIILGDIVISLEKAMEQSKEYGHSFMREVGFLTVHGMLHLLGYDHMEEADRLTMRSREESVLEGLKLSRD